MLSIKLFDAFTDGNFSFSGPGEVSPNVRSAGGGGRAQGTHRRTHGQDLHPRVREPGAQEVRHPRGYAAAQQQPKQLLGARISCSDLLNSLIL